MVALAAFAVLRFGPGALGEAQLAPTLWPFAGLAFAACVRWGTRMWPALLLGAALALVARDVAPASALAFAFIHSTIGAACGWVLRRSAFQPALDRSHDL